MYMKKKITALIIATMVATVICTSCGKKDVDYDTSEESGEVASGMDAEIKHDEEVSEAVFEDTVEVEGTKINIYAEADIKKVDSYNVYSAKPKVYTEEDYRQLVAEQFGGKLYRADYDSLPKSYLNARKESYEYRIEQGTITEDDRYDYEVFMQQYENAPDNWQETTDYSELTYVVEKDGNAYMLAFAEDGRGYNYKKIDEYDNGISNGLLEPGLDYTKNGRRKYYKPEDIGEDIKPYIEKADEIVHNEMNLKDFEVQFCTPRELKRQNQQNDNYIPYGYVLVYNRQLDGLVCDSNRFVSSFWDSNSVCMDMLGDTNEYVYIAFDPYYDVVRLQYSGPLEEVKVKDKNVNIIDFNKAQTIILQELIDNPRTHYYSTIPMDGESEELIEENIVDEYRYMSLEYYTIREEGIEDYRIIPVWCLREMNCSIQGQAQVLVNALDGSIIHINDRVFHDPVPYSGD